LFYQDKNSKRKTEFDSLIDSLKMFKERLAILEHKIELQEKSGIYCLMNVENGKRSVRTTKRKRN
jgi:hypothetical protein